MQIAIIGAGFSGMAAAWHLQKKFTHAKITLYDYRDIGCGTSGIAVGLLHPFMGPDAKLNALGREGVAATQELLHEAGDVITARGILRIPTNEKQEIAFRRIAEKYEDTSWRDGLYIHSGIVVDCPGYLKKLCSWEIVKEKVAPSQLTHDLIIVTAGAETRHLYPQLIITPIKGQLLEYATIEPCQPTTREGYKVMQGQNTIAGATFEREFETEEPDMVTALKLLSPLFPEFSGQTPLHCKAGVRASCPKHLPLIQQMDSRTWVYTGLGSKGLLYHALFAQKLVGELDRAEQE